MEIDSRVPQGQLAASRRSAPSARSTSPTRDRKPSARASCSTAGAASQMDADRAANDLKAAEAQLRTVEEQIRTSRTDLGYYRVTAPTAGIVGDIPVREGDRVTKATKLTSIDANAGLEVYLNVPVQQAREASGRPAGPHRRRHGRDDCRRENQFRVAVGRRADANRARENTGLGAGHAAHRSVRAHVRHLDDRARTDRAGHSGHTHQRPMVCVRRGTGRRRQRSGGEDSDRSSWDRSLETSTRCQRIEAGEKLITAGIQKIRDGAPVQAGPAKAGHYRDRVGF